MRFCSECFAPTVHDPCRICGDARRDHSIICAVEDLPGLLAIEEAGEYRGLYHVLHGVIDPINGIGPDQLRFRELLARIQRPEIKAIVISLNANIYGHATATYILRAISQFDIRITRRP